MRANIVALIKTCSDSRLKSLACKCGALSKYSCLRSFHYLRQILREVVTEDSKGLAIDSQVIDKTTLIQTLREEERHQ